MLNHTFFYDVARKPRKCPSDRFRSCVGTVRIYTNYTKTPGPTPRRSAQKGSDQRRSDERRRSVRRGSIGRGLVRRGLIRSALIRVRCEWLCSGSGRLQCWVDQWACRRWLAGRSHGDTCVCLLDPLPGRPRDRDRDAENEEAEREHETREKGREAGSNKQRENEKRER